MAETVDVPKLGQFKKSHLLAAGGVVAGILVYAYWSRARAAEEPVAAPEPEDPFEGSFGSGGVGSVSGYPSGDDSSDDTRTKAPRTNAEWADLAAEKLVDSYEMQAINAALGRYLGRQPLSTLDQDIVRAAIARAGYPPEGTYAIIPGGTTSLLVAPSGLTGTATTSAVALRWNAVAGATSYVVFRDGVTVATVTGTSTTVGSLGQSTRYSFEVAAVGANGAQGPKSASFAITTGKATTPAPAPSKPVPGKPAPAPAKRYPTRWKSVVHLPGDNYTKIANRHRLRMSGVELYNYQFSAQAGRTASAKATLKSRGPNKIMPGGSTVLPYPK